MRWLVLALLAAGLAGCTPEKGEQPGLAIHVQIGQSQMVGKEALAVPPRFIHEDKIQVFDGETWRPGPLDERANPGMPFADAMVEATGQPVGLIQCAVGGTTMAQWQPSNDPNSLYGRCLDLIRRGWAAGRVRGVIVWQGESDTITLGQVDAWTPGFLNLVEGLRRDLDTPDLPVVFAQIGPSGGPSWPYWAVLQEMQSRVRGRNISMIETADLPLIPGDRVHISARGMLTAGQRFAEKMSGMVD